MKIISTTLLLTVLLPTFCLAGHTATDFDIQWIQDQHVIGVNREAGHATLIPYSSKAALLADEYHKRPWVTPTKAQKASLDIDGKSGTLVEEVVTLTAERLDAKNLLSAPDKDVVRVKTEKPAKRLRNFTFPAESVQILSIKL